MKAISIIQPWATLIAHGEKRIETRSWQTSYRGLIAIHASRLTDEAEDFCVDIPVAAELLVQHGYELPGDKPGGSLPWGSIVAIADLFDIVPTGHTSNYPVQEYLLGDHSRGRFAWRLRNVARLEKPVPCRGRPGIWDVPAELEGLLAHRLEQTP